MIRKKTNFLLIVLTALPGLIFSYEKYAMLNLSVPSDLEERQMQFSIAHRFYGVATEKPLETFFGMHGGANPGLGVHVVVAKGIGISGAYVFNSPLKAYSLGIQYKIPFPAWLFQFQIEGEYFSFEQAINCRKSHMFFQMVSRIEPLFNRFTPVFNLGYDGYNEKLGLGLGADIQITENMHFIGEYYPIIDSELENRENSFAVGIKVLTYGHQFHLLLGNSYGLGNRSLMQGTDSNDLHFGFTIHRFFEF